jgi:cellulose 1,4-beta-cellobiosidase
MPSGLKVLAGLAAAATVAVAQQVGTNEEEVQPIVWTEECTAAGCSYEKNTVTLDANWRWINKEGKNCYTDESTWDETFCPDPEQCATNCAVEGAKYEESYGIKGNQYQDGVDLTFVTKSKYSDNFGSRIYVLDGDKYKMFHLLNREFTMTVDVSKLPCGLNGAVYFVEMDEKGDENGGSNTAGAKYGVGYCDGQCPHDIKFMKGKANVVDWDNEHTPPIGKMGACCAEMDIWEANSMSTAYTPHPCEKPGLTVCDGIECGDNAKDQRYEGICDKDGCDFNSYRMGDKKFYGPGSEYTVDTTKPFTIVTQFITDDGTDTGTLVDIVRFYVQHGKVIENSKASILGPKGGNSITDEWCSAQKRRFGDPDDFTKKGGLKTMGEALGRGMVLVLSLWDDSDVSMLWLDSKFPVDKPASTPGVARGPCPGGEQSKPAYVRENYPDAHVEFYQIRVGTIGSTFSGSGSRRLDSNFV